MQQGIDYLENYDLIPENIQTILSEHFNGDWNYEICKKLVENLEKVGWTCDFGLDAEPYDLKPINN